MRLSLALPMLVLLGLAGCASTSSLTYTPTASVMPGPAVIAGVTVNDTRDEKPNRLATVRGGYGNPLYVRDTALTVADEVNAVFTKALQSRGMLAPGGAGPFRVVVALRTFYGNQFVTRTANIDLDMIVLDRAGREIYRHAVKDNRSQFEFFAGPNIDYLQKVTEDLLDATVDGLVDDPRFRAALRAAAPVG